MILEIDAGNSRIKWRTVDFESRHVFASGVVADAGELVEAIDPESELSAARMSCVRGPDAIVQFQDWIERTWQIPLQVARVQRKCSGVSVHYEDLTRLGVDRWLAMLAAFQRTKSACVVVDAGTALTIDVLDSSGSHLGGYILPGYKLMTRVIQENTRIRLTRDPEPATEPGHSTEAAVCNAIYASQVALLEKVLRDTGNGNSGTRLILAGGDARVLLELSAIAREFSAEVVADLVLDGLALACAANGGH